MLLTSAVNDFTNPELLKAKYCLAPAGFGWGARLKTGLVRGCVPVIVQDGIKVGGGVLLIVHDGTIHSTGQEQGVRGAHTVASTPAPVPTL